MLASYGLVVHHLAVELTRVADLQQLGEAANVHFVHVRGCYAGQRPRHLTLLGQIKYPERPKCVKLRELRPDHRCGRPEPRPHPAETTAKQLRRDGAGATEDAHFALQDKAKSTTTTTQRSSKASVCYCGFVT